MEGAKGRSQVYHNGQQRNRQVPLHTVSTSQSLSLSLTHTHTHTNTNTNTGIYPFIHMTLISLHTSQENKAGEHVNRIA